MTSDGLHWDGGSSVGCLVGTRGFRRNADAMNRMRHERRDFEERHVGGDNPADDPADEPADDPCNNPADNPSGGPNDTLNPTATTGRNSLTLTPTQQRSAASVKYDAEFPSILFTGSLLAPREGSLLHEHNVPSYVRAWYGMPNVGVKPISWDFCDRNGGVELHVRGDGRVYDFAYTSFSTASAQWDYVCAPFRTTDRSSSLFPLLESMKLGDFWDQEVQSLDFNKDINVTSVNKRANQWVKKRLSSSEMSPHVADPEQIGLDYDVIRIPWSHFFVRADEKKVNHLVPLPETAVNSFEFMNNAGIGIYSDELGDFACEILFVGVYKDETARSLSNPNMTIKEEEGGGVVGGGGVGEESVSERKPESKPSVSEDNHESTTSAKKDML